MDAKISEIAELIRGLFNSTLSSEVASELTRYVMGGSIENATPATPFSIPEIREFRAQIHGHADNNIDLPTIQFALRTKYYVAQDMPDSQRTMIESAMCAAENLAGLGNCRNLFSLENQDYARIINFYRKYFKETYSTILIGTLKQIASR